MVITKHDVNYIVLGELFFKAKKGGLDNRGKRTTLGQSRRHLSAGAHLTLSSPQRFAIAHTSVLLDLSALFRSLPRWWLTTLPGAGPPLRASLFPATTYLHLHRFIFVYFFNKSSVSISLHAEPR